MMRVKFFSDFCSSQHCKEKMEKIFQTSLKENDGKYKEIFITTEEDYTHAVILNKAMPELHIAKEKVIGLAYEPYEFLCITQEFIEYAKKNIGVYFIGSKRQLPDPFQEHYAFMWYNPTQQYIFHKKNIMSIVLSDKQSAPGHSYRHQIVKEIQKRGLPIDIYGRGAHLYKGKNVKGKFCGEEPYQDYLFTICIENFQNECYFSEKIIDPAIRQCMPLYIGSNNIREYFPDILSLNGILIDDIALIEQVVTNPTQYYRQSHVNTILTKINLIDFLLQHFA